PSPDRSPALLLRGALGLQFLLVRLHRRGVLLQLVAVGLDRVGAAGGLVLLQLRAVRLARLPVAAQCLAVLLHLRLVRRSRRGRLSGRGAKCGGQGDCNEGASHVLLLWKVMPARTRQPGRSLTCFASLLFLAEDLAAAVGVRPVGEARLLAVELEVRDAVLVAVAAARLVEAEFPLGKDHPRGAAFRAHEEALAPIAAV